MKLAILDSWFHWPPRGGAIRAVKEIANGLTKRGVEVVLIVPKLGYRGAVDPKADFLFTIRKLSFFLFDGPQFYSKSREALKEIKPDAVLITNGNLLKPYMVMACKDYPAAVRLYAYEILCPASYGINFRLGRICEFDFIHNPLRCLSCPEYLDRVLHNTAGIEVGDFVRSYSFFPPAFYPLAKRSIRQASKFIVTSQFMAKRFSGIIPTNRVTTIPDGVDTETLTRKEFSHDQGPSRIGFFGRVDDPLKGMNVVLQACSLLWKRRQDFRLTTTGTVRGQSAHPFVFQSHWRHEDEVPSLYQNSRIVTVPSIWAEPFGLTALEAMSCEVPVIASRVGGLTELIKDGETGLLFPPGDYLKLASRIEMLLDDDVYRKKLGYQAREHTVRNFSWPLIIDRYMALLDGMASNSPSSWGNNARTT